MGASHPPLPALAADSTQGGSDVVDSLSPTNQSPSDVPRYVFRWRLELLFASPTKRLVPAFVVGALIAFVGFVVSIAAVVLQLIFPPSPMSPLSIEQLPTSPPRKRARGPTASPPQSPPRVRRAATSQLLTPATSASSGSGSQASEAVEGSPALTGGAAAVNAIGNSLKSTAATCRSRFRSAPTVQQDYFYQGDDLNLRRPPLTSRIGSCCSPHASSSKTAFSDESASANQSACSLVASSAGGSLPDEKQERMGRVGGGGLKRIRAAFTRRPTSSRVASSSGGGACETDGTCSSDHHDEDVSLPLRSRSTKGHARTPSLLSDEGTRVGSSPAPLPELHLPTPSPTDSQPSSPAQALNATLFEEQPVQTPSSSSLSPPTSPPMKPHTTFHVPNILRRPSSASPASSSRGRTLSSPAPVLKRTPTNKSVANSSGGGGLCPKHRQRKPKPPPLRTAYTYTFAPSPELEASSFPSTEEVEEIATNSGDDVGPRDEAVAASSRSRSRGAAERRPQFVSMQTMPIFTPLKPRVAGTLPQGILLHSSLPTSTPTTAGSMSTNYSMASGPASTNTSMSSSSRLGSSLARRANSMKRRSTGLVELNEEGVSEFGERVDTSSASKRRSMPPRPSADMLSLSDAHARASSEGQARQPHPLAESMSPDSGSETAQEQQKKKNRRFSLR